MSTERDGHDGFEDNADWHTFLSEFRRELGSIMRHISRRMPAPALAAASAKLQAALIASLQPGMPVEVQCE